ncbi:hypothetical protein BDZ89DRAFT_449206 [Hymenopellis radicata]|nr:hypothetical protein BDZ89DRAFT_449206 [Hymenopellis radicata]
MCMLRRRRSGGPVNVPTTPAVVLPSASVGATHDIRSVPHLDSRRALRYAITRDLKEGDVAVRIRRFTKRRTRLQHRLRRTRLRSSPRWCSGRMRRSGARRRGVFYVRYKEQQRDVSQPC